MKKLLLATAALLATTVVGNAAIIDNLGSNPTSAQGDFTSVLGGVNATGNGLFSDQILFQLTNAQTITVASATNSFPGGNTTTDFITNFAASIYSYGLDNLFDGPGIGDDSLLFGPQFATLGCSNLCQNLFGIATLDAGSYYVSLTGTGGGTSGYGGNISTLAVPGPIAGAGIPGLLTAFGAVGVWWKRRRQQAHA